MGGKNVNDIKLKSQDLNSYGSSPYLTPMQRRLAQQQNTPADQAANVSADPSDLNPYSYTGRTYRAAATPQSLPEFDKARENVVNTVRRDANAARSSTQDALQRKFTSMGLGASGSAIKQSRLADENIQESASNAISGQLANIGMEEARQIRSMDEAEKQRQFQSEEAASGYQFTGEQARMQRLQDIIKTNAQVGISNAQMSNAFKQALFDADSKIYAIDLEWQKAQQSGAQEEFNAEMAKYKAERSGGLFGSGGFLGLGL